MPNEKDAPIEKDAEEILNKFSQALDKIPDNDETYYITDNLNLDRKDKSNPKESSKILRNAKTDKENKVIVKKADWI